MGLLHIIGGLFSSAGRAIAGVASSAWQGIKSVFHFAAGVFDLVGGAWDWMLNGVTWLGDNLVGALARLLHLLEWLALHAIPEGLSWVFREGVRWARAAVHAARHAVEVALHTAVRFLHLAIRTVEHWARSAVRLIWHTLSSVWNWIETAGRKLWEVVMHPARLAAWLGGHVIDPLIRWLISNGAALVVFLVRLMAREAGAIAGTIEDALAKLI